jgi:hypothetical protein
MLCSAVYKMVASPEGDVKLVDRKRPYILLGEKSPWTWTSLGLAPGVTPERFLDYSQMPTREATQFLLLRDLGAGSDGRVWMVCSRSKLGRVGVVKFALPSDFGCDSEQERRQRLEAEGEVWRRLWNMPDVRVVTLCGKPALLMPYIEPYTSITDAGRKPTEQAVRAAVADVASAGYCHLDLRWRHVGVFPASAAYHDATGTSAASEGGTSASEGRGFAREQRVIFFDLGRMRHRIRVRASARAPSLKCWPVLTGRLEEPESTFT